jgi:RHS repeat-associated protein
VAKYHYDGGGLIAMTRNNQSYWYGFEGIGTTRQLMGSQGQVVDTYAFDAWGNEITSPQSQVQNPFKYVGKYGYYWDTDSALMLLGVRYYSAANGLFLSRDLIEGYGYTYAADNPARWMDPQGLQFEEPNNQTCSIVNGQRECAPSGKGIDERICDTDDQKGFVILTKRRDFKKCLPINCARALGRAYHQFCKGSPIDYVRFTVIVWCIVEGESDWNPNCRTPIPKPIDGHHGQHACGLFQIVGVYHDKDCRNAGFPNWKTDPVDNIMCGMMLLCNCLRQNSWNICKCKNLYNTIGTKKFNECMRRYGQKPPPC